MDKPSKPLPKWVEPLCVAGFCLAAVLEWNAGNLFWAYLFAIAALVFSITGILNRRRP